MTLGGQEASRALKALAPMALAMQSFCLQGFFLGIYLYPIICFL